ncbi:Pimeloyl-ACP methyl ester carboxylesterase [Paenimyroides ummariense]|uniref:Pimeloyl-ACP methyl ester carboxylesterase n=1 Tax=Paenimyroides ummariense TaxID=913024 RepID=A0A1I5DM16_9FLAO|nr:alpha/beta hydrolase [Paenimyroides ummariense]SFO00200.1 Pimeloyl-ACP methyl ester carboxylesterase [Paenimyroides ummariense]
MEKYIRSTDNINIHYTETGNGNIIIAFVHGWLGNTNWWQSQERYFSEKFKVIQIDLGGHGKSDKSRTNWTSEQYADDIQTVLNQYTSCDIILVGHSMSGAYVVEASINLPQVKALIVVDTLRDLDQEFSPEQAEKFMFKHYRKDFKDAVENLLTDYLFVKKTPEIIKKQLQHEFLQNKPDLAINTLSPLYEMDIKKFAKQTNIPVRAINSDAATTNLENNRKYFKNYSYTTISETGHYPMLEKPDEFNMLLDKVFKELIL